MNLTKGQRFEIIKKLSRSIVDMGEIDGVLFLETHTNNKEYFRNEYDKVYFEYLNVIRFIQSLDNKIVFQMYQYLFPEASKKEFSINNPKYYLGTDKLVVFLSHSHKQYNLVQSVKTSLEKTDWIQCFFAHKDIQPTTEWEKEIRKYLECCHLMLVFLSSDFKSSNFCDQEAGVALHRGILIIPIKINEAPYGFLSHIQAINGNEREPETLAEEIEMLILDTKNDIYNIAKPKLQKAVDRLKANFIYSTNPVMAESVLDQLTQFKKGQIDINTISDIKQQWDKNDKINQIKNIEEKMSSFFQQHS